MWSLRTFYRWMPRKLQHRLRVVRHVVLGKGEPELRYLVKQPRRWDLAIDVGANVGVYSEILSRLSTTVLALEPNPDCVASLAEVLPPNCMICQRAASDRSGEVILRVPIVADRPLESRGTITERNLLMAKASKGVRKYRVRSAPIDAVIEEMDLADRRVDFIKVDVEGHEYEAVTGAWRTITRHRPTLLVETEIQHGAPVNKLFSLMEAMGYTSRVLRAGKLVPTGANDFIEAQLCPKYANNVWFVPMLER